MPNRILKDSFFTSPNLCHVSLEAETLFMRLICLADDRGRFLAHPAAIRGTAYWNRLTVKESHVGKWLTELERHNLIRTYQVGAKDYGFFPTWAEHQRIRNVKEKFPSPPDNLPQIAAGLGDLLSESESESESESNPKSNTNSPTALSAFDQIWMIYPRKVGKKAARSAWERAKINGQLPKVLAAIERQKQSAQWQSEGGRFIPHLATWLNQGRWDDEPTEVMGEAYAAGKKRNDYTREVLEIANEMLERKK